MLGNISTPKTQPQSILAVSSLLRVKESDWSPVLTLVHFTGSGFFSRHQMLMVLYQQLQLYASLGGSLQSRFEIILVTKNVGFVVV